MAPFNQGNIEIRTMTHQDYDGVYHLWINTPGMALNNLDDSREGVEKFLIRNPTTCFVAIKQGRIIGVILSGHDGRRGHIYHMAVAIPERKHGIGAKLLDAALSGLKQEGINKVSLVVFSNNDIGNHFWEKCGFTVRYDVTYRNKEINASIRLDT